MIIDTTDNLGKYVSLNPLFANVIDFLKQHDISNMDEGIYPIKDQDVLVNISVCKRRTMDTAELETHCKMTDIQMPLSCKETFGYKPLCDLPDFVYDAEKDITKYGATQSQTYITIQPGQMIIFFPEDGHAPCVSEQPVIKKAIFKVKTL